MPCCAPSSTRTRSPPPLWLSETAAAGAISSADRADFAPWSDCLIAPVVARGTLVGVIAIGPPVYSEPYTLEDLDLLRNVAGQMALAVENARLFEQVEAQAFTDYLTALPNHRALQEQFSEKLDAAAERGAPLSVVMVDIDNFKLLNDVYGHQVGDDALRCIASLLRLSLRTEDMVGRYGGDEFLFVLPNRARSEAEAVMERIARRVEAVPLSPPSVGLAAARAHPRAHQLGVASYPEDGETRKALISVADSDMLQRRYRIRPSARTGANRPAVRAMLEGDPRTQRFAQGLLDLLDAKDPYTSEHSEQVASLGLLMADEAGLPDDERFTLWLGGLLHDVGKIGTPADILRKPGKLTPDEWEAMRRHPSMGEEMLRGLGLSDVIDIVGSHHERFDGTGYPRGLSGDEIPRLARMIAVADAFSAMVHDRPYRSGLSWGEALEELHRFAGTQFDPAMVDIFARAMSQAEGEVAA